MKMTDADGEASEATVWLDFAKDCSYLEPTESMRLISIYEEIGGMINNPEKFLPRQT